MCGHGRTYHYKACHEIECASGYSNIEPCRCKTRHHWRKPSAHPKEDLKTELEALKKENAQLEKRIKELERRIGEK